MRFAKMQGVGNDFVVLSAEDVSLMNLPSVAECLCDRHRGIGADGLLVIGQPTQNSAFSFQMFNPDGSEDMCGNGLRCAGLWAYKRKLISVGEYQVSTRDGLKFSELINVRENFATVRVDMGAPKLRAAELPASTRSDTLINAVIEVADRHFTATVVNTGSTHSVVFGNEPVSEEEFFTYSPVFENLQLFPERTSVLWAHKTAQDVFNVRIWERGAGETLGCGTGGCAVAVAAIVTEQAERNTHIVVSSKGGDLTINWGDTVWMTGPAAFVFEGSINL